MSGRIGEEKPVKTSLPNQTLPKRYHLAAYLIVLLALLVPRLFQLDHFVAVDEINWLHRSANFYSSFIRGDYSGTFVNRTPGVITSWIGAAAFRIQMPYYGISNEAQRSSYYMFELVLREQGVHPMDILQVARLLMVLFLSAVLLLSFYYSVRLFGLWPSLVSFLLLASDPFLSALSRMNHLDAPQAFLMGLSLLSFTSFFVIEKRYRDLLVSGAAGGMALLAKLPGIFLLPVILLLAAYFLWQKNKTDQRPAFGGWPSYLMVLLIWLTVFCAVFFILWPAMWVEPFETLSKVFVQILRYSSTAAETVGIGQINIPDDIEPFGGLSVTEPAYSAAYFFRYPMFFLWRATPMVLVGLVLFIYYSIKKQLLTRSWAKSLMGAWLLILIYTLGMTLPWKGSEKYYAPVFLLVCLIAGLGWFLLSDDLRIRTGKNWLASALVITVLAAQFMVASSHFPYYFTYFNPLLGGPRRAAQTRMIGVGEGLDIAARYLESKPGSEGLRVMSFYGIGPFSYFFPGKVEPIYDVTEDLWSKDFVRKLQRMDYLVIYTNQKFRNGPSRLFALLEEVPPEYVVELHGADYVWIYDPAKIPLENEVWD